MTGASSRDDAAASGPPGAIASTLLVARKDVQDAIRAYTLHALTAAFVLVGGFLAALHWVPVMYRGSPVASDTLALLNSLRQPTVLLVPLIGLALSYWSIAGERERGSLKLLLGLPATRPAVVAGKFLGRTAVVGVATLVGFGVAGGIALASYDTFDVAVFAGYTAMTLCYGAVFVAVGIGFSTGLPSRTKAMAGAGTLYVLFLIGWDVVLTVLVALTGRSITEDAVPAWIQIFGWLNPSWAFTYATRSVVPEYEAVTRRPGASAAGLEDWVGFPILAAWIVVPLLFGYLRFRAVDL